jgi:molybdenum cofactor cytidylyltransferase
MISAVVLAAGESKRMGRPKLLMPLGRSTILRHTIDNLLNSRVSEVVVVVGYKADEVVKTIAGRPVKIVINPAYRQGMSTSIRCHQFLS